MKRALFNELRKLAGGRCDYCRMPERFDPLPFQVDHIIAQQHHGLSILENLAWTCLHCNKRKGPNIAGIDPESGELAALFHPRQQNWRRHFFWDGAVLRGRTRSARATIAVLNINNPDFLAFRAELIHEGVF